MTAQSPLATLFGEQRVLTSAASEQPDGFVVAAVLAGDRDQFAELVDRYHSALLRVAYSRLGCREWAEDVVQEALLNAFKSLHTYDSQYSFRTWLWTILLNQCNRHYKKQMRRASVRSRSEQTATEAIAAQQTARQLRSTESPSDQLLATERSDRLNALLDQLPEKQADALRLRFFGGLKFREIAVSMDCSLSTAKNRVRWGLTQMADQLGANEDSNRRPTAENCHERPDEL
jgi:RNA polymerase sigma-70 factor (ECF subfamily)